MTVVKYPPVFLTRGRNPQRLPSARAISNAVHSGANDVGDRRRHSLLVMQFGQLLDHDLTLTPEMSTCVEGCPGPEAEVECCHVTDAPAPKFCWPIEIPEHDVFFVGKRLGRDFQPKISSEMSSSFWQVHGI